MHFVGAKIHRVSCCRGAEGGQGSAAAKAAAAADDDAARRRFGNAKSISSAQFSDNNDGFKDAENQVNAPLEMAANTHVARRL